MAEIDPPFAVTFREDNPNATARIGVYEQALELTELVDRVVDKAEGARFHLKEHLDKSAMVVALRIAQAAGEMHKSDRRKQYRFARKAATDCAALLDIMARRKSIDPGLLAPARTLVLALVSQLAHLATR